MLVKICGLSNFIDAKTAVDMGADALGFVMGGSVLPVEVEPSAQTVRQIIKEVPKGVESFLVTHLTDPKEILDLANYIDCTGIQVSEDIGQVKLRNIRQQTNKQIIKTVVVTSGEGMRMLDEYQDYCDFILLDTRFGGYTGGTGITNDWKLCAQIIKKSKKPVYLAGGLNIENLNDAMKQTDPAGVDVSTGVSEFGETYPKKDRKNKEKIKKFIEIAKSYETKN